MFWSGTGSPVSPHRVRWGRFHRSCDNGRRTYPKRLELFADSDDLDWAHRRWNWRQGSRQPSEKKERDRRFLSAGTGSVGSRISENIPNGPLSDGLAEAIKVAVALDPKLFEFLERFSSDLLKSPATADPKDLKELVWQSTLGLLNELEPNLYEDKTYQRVLDFGHTFSPFIESMSDFRVTHGVAVGLDIALSSAVAYELDLLSCGDRNRILASLQSAGLPIYSHLLTAENCFRSLEEIEAHRGGHLNLVVPSGIGQSRFITERRSVSSQLLKSAIISLNLSARRRLFVADIGSVTPAAAPWSARITRAGRKLLQKAASG